MKHNAHLQNRPNRLNHQRGVVLFVALIVLVAMSLAGISMMRSVDAGNKIAGNLANRQGATHAAEFAFEQAIAQLRTLTSTGAASEDSAGAGYSSDFQSQPHFERDWNTAWNLGTDAVTGNNVSVFIDRMCSGTDCQSMLTFSSAAEGIGHSGSLTLALQREHYRVLARVTTPQGLVTYLEEKIY
jgi:type IV pilus assembly protein PilX